MNLPPNVTAVKDRHGKMRFRFRKAGLASRYVCGTPGEEDFNASYARCLNPANPPDRNAKPRRTERIPPAALKGVSVVYFVGMRNGTIKIGTTVNLPDRLKKLQTGSASPLSLLAVVEGGQTLESEYHAKFAACHVHGEWFRGKAIREEINRLKKASSWPTIRTQKLSNPKK